MKGYILVEGEGELGAAENLVTRLWQEAGHWQPWARAITCKNTHQRRGIEKGSASSAQSATPAPCSSFAMKTTPAPGNEGH